MEAVQCGRVEADVNSIKNDTRTIHVKTALSGNCRPTGQWDWEWRMAEFQETRQREENQHLIAQCTNDGSRVLWPRECFGGMNFVELPSQMT